MFPFERRRTVNPRSMAVWPTSWRDLAGKLSNQDLWVIASLVVSISVIAVLMYYAEVRGAPSRHFYRYLLIFPIALAAYSFGISGGLGTALSCTAVFFPILVQYTRQFGLSEETVEVLSIVIFFNLFALIVANLAEFQQRQERLHLILDRIGGLFEKGLDTEQLATAILNSGMEICRAQLGEVFVVDEVTGELELIAQEGLASTDRVIYEPRAGWGTPLAEWLLANNQPLLINDVSRDPRLERRPGDPRIQSVLAVPLRRGNEAVGFVALMNAQDGLFTSEDLTTLEAIVDRSQMAIENARLYEQTDEDLRRRLQEFADLAQLSVALSATLELEQTLHAAVGHAVDALGASMCDIRLVEGEALNLGVASGFRAKGASQVQIKISARLQQMVQDFRPLAVEDLEREAALPAIWRSWALNQGARAYLGVPMISQGSTVGILSVYRDEPYEWLAHDIRFSVTIANTLASAIANAQLFETVSEGKRWTELVLQGIADGVMTTDLDGRIQSFNSGAERLTGRFAEQVVGRPCCEVFGLPDREDTESQDEPCSHQKAIANVVSGFQTFKSSLIRADGARLTLANTTAPLLDQFGKPIGAVTIFRDVSKEERLDRMKTDFVSMVSHELRTPLANIMASVNLLGHARLGPRDEQEIIEILAAESRRLNRFVEDILSAARLEAGEIQVRLQPVTVSPLLHRAIEAVKGKGVEHRFEIRIQPDLPYVLADESQLEIVLHNLLTNAVHYSSERSTITVEASEVEGEVVISVSDEGVGIAPQYQEHIFERFYRPSTTDAQRVYGYGLGLYICKGLVEAQGGQIWLESQEGIGSRFSFTLRPFDVGEAGNG